MWVDTEGEGGMKGWKTCPDCLKYYKRTREGKRARKEGGAWGKGKWPSWVYHTDRTRKCFKCHAYALANSAARRAGIERATPKWADRSEIVRIYDECLAKTKQTGIAHEVDHIIPLRGEFVSGLHVHWNLRVITRAENSTKSNKLLPEFA